MLVKVPNFDKIRNAEGISLRKGFYCFSSSSYFLNIFNTYNIIIYITLNIYNIRGFFKMATGHVALRLQRSGQKKRCTLLQIKGVPSDECSTAL